MTDPFRDPARHRAIPSAMPSATQVEGQSPQPTADDPSGWPAASWATNRDLKLRRSAAHSESSEVVELAEGYPGS
jgi:hypothetical protein